MIVCSRIMILKEKQTTVKHWMFTAVALIIVCILFINTTAYPDVKHRSKGQWWIYMYTEVLPSENKYIDKARLILKNLWNQAQRSGIKPPKLIVIPRKYDQEVTSQAFILPDSSLIITESLLDLTIAKNEADEATGEARLAFVLSHELTHLLNKDHKHFGSVLLFQKIVDKNYLKDARLAELHADENGIFIMTMAGYKPKQVFDLDGTNFFADYQNKIRKKLKLPEKTKNDEMHPEAILRAEELRLRLVMFTDKLRLFATGIERYHQERYRQSEELFRTFFHYFPSREVANNTGLSIFQQARNRVAGCKDLHYRLKPAILLDGKTRGDIFIDYIKKSQISEKDFIACRPDAQFRELIKSAEEFLTLAEKKDDGYQSAKVNQAALKIIEGNYSAAIQAIEPLFLEDPANPYSKTNLALALFLSDPEGYRSRSLSLLREISAESTIYQQTLINIGLMVKVDE